MKRALVFLFLASLPLRADHYPRQPGIKILKYDFDVTLTDASDEIAVKATIDVQAVADGGRSVDLDLCNLVSQAAPYDRLNPCLVPPPNATRAQRTATPAPSSVGKGMTVTGVTASGQALQYEHRNDRLHVSFPQTMRAGQKLTFSASYHGVPAMGLWIGKNRYGDRGFFTDNWPNKARNWLATIDHISVKTPKTIRVTAPRHYQVLSNGRLTEQTDLPGDLRRTSWEEAEPIPSWQFSLAVAQYSVQYFGRAHDVEFSGWFYPQNAEAGRKEVDPLTQAVYEFYRDHIGPYGYEKVAHVEAAGSGGATEPATTIFYFGGFGALSHEMAHQWWGDAVTESDWDDVWLSEGFATYFALLFTEHQQGRDAFLNGVRRTREQAVQYALAHPSDTVVHNNLEHDSEVFSNGPQIYQGGAMVLQTLRGVLGDEVFWAGIRLYYKRFLHASATSDDLRRAMEDACHAAAQCAPENQDLTWFFREWLNRGGIMELNGTWQYDAAAKNLQITLDQTQTQGLYRMPIEIGITQPTPPAAPQNQGGRPAPPPPAPKIFIDKQHNVLNIPLETAPTDVQLDPNLWVPLMRATFQKR